MMKRVLIGLVGLMGLAAGAAAQAQQAWLLLNRSDHHELATTADGHLETVLKLGNVAAYGGSPQALAFIYSEPGNRAFRLDVLDKATRRVMLTLPIDARLQAHMAGIVEDVVVGSRYVYFLSIGTNSARQVVLNSLQGRLQLNQIRLADGAVKSFPLPPACHTGHIVDYDGVPLVYAWNGTGVWRFDEGSSAVVALVPGTAAADITANESGNCNCKSTPGPGPFADDVAVPGAGVFRVSRMGKLEKLLDAHLGVVNAPRASVDLGMDLGADGQFASLSRGVLNGRPVLGVLGVSGKETVFQYRNPDTLAILWQVRFPATVVSPARTSLAVASGLLFVDQSKGTIDRATPAGTQVLWNLHELDPTAVSATTRVILFSDTSQVATPAAGS